MNSNNDALKRSALSTMLGLARVVHSPDSAKRLAAFISAYYADIPAEDIALFSAVDLYGATLCHWRFAANRQPGQAKVRAYNPIFEEDGWHSQHTIIEVINDDMPFLVDSVCMALNRLGLTLHLVFHPQLPVVRGDNGRLKDIDDNVDAPNESFIHIEVDRQDSAEALRALESDIQTVLEDVRAAVEDWDLISAIRGQINNDLEATPPGHLADEIIDEAVSFLHWLGDDHFTFLGYRKYDLVSDAQGKQLKASSPGYGILRDALRRDEKAGLGLSGSTLEEILSRQDLLLITKANNRATVHRSTYLDFIAVRRFNVQGEMIGEHRFLGLFTSSVYSSNPRDVPILRRKLQSVLANVAYPALSHKGKTLLHILENYPRDELWEIDVETLERISLGILHLQERQVVRLFLREDRFCRYVSCQVFVPRDNYNTEVRHKMQQILMDAFGGVSAEFNVTLSESMLARVHFTVRTPNGIPDDYDAAVIEQQLINAARRWKDHLQIKLRDDFGEADGNALFRRYANAFPIAYHEEFDAQDAVGDIRKMQTLKDEQDLSLAVYSSNSGDKGRVHLKVFRFGQPVVLSTSLDILENLGVQVIDEHPYRIEPVGEQVVWISDFGLQLERGISAERLQENFLETFALAFRGDIDNDGFNRLVLRARIEWREANILRAYWRYLKQVGAMFSQHYVQNCLSNHAHIAAKLIEFFHARLSPQPRINEQSVLEEVRTMLNEVPSLDDDRILSSFLALIQATTRTNYYQRDVNGKFKPWLSFKFDPNKIPGLPEPKPWAEIFVYARCMEGVHLRGGPVARGGIRWSDRLEDFRTEILGLMKAQMVKNSIIVPVGAKGGFICKCLPATNRNAVKREAQRCYEWFIRGLLDLTDNRRNGKVTPPDNVRRHDGDDPYLVVAADKGTATYSDIANRIARENEFWLDDAFASGGSQGYDHKKLGITARGAWESAKTHFHGLGINIENTSFTVIGIGDMSGDVFGNGMLQSKNIRLLAAFDREHIFIDPDPDAEVSFAERERLFKLAASSWADYDASKISPGGGVFSRTAKTIRLSPQARLALGSKSETATPNEIVKEILKAPVDLLFNGGIGTYVKASHQTHIEVNDKANDAVRVNGQDLRARVAVEGGNLGFSQAGRVEYALAGGRIYNDAVDNCAGVNCSDHEVNLKILLSHLMAQGELTRKQRDTLLRSVETEVAAQVLRNSQKQCMALEISTAVGPQLLHVHSRYIQDLEKQGKLKRALEFLPSEEELARRKLANQGLTNPELAVLTAYAKLTTFPEILASDLPRQLEFLPWLARYFPSAVVEQAVDALPSHFLKHEIIATVLTNEIVNRMGSTFLYRLNDETGTSVPAIIRTWSAAVHIFDAQSMWEQIEALGFDIPASAQIELQLEMRRLLERATRWILRNYPSPQEIDQVLDDYTDAVKQYKTHIAQLLPSATHADIRAQEANWINAGIPSALASTLSRSEALLAVLDILQIDNSVQLGLDTVARVYFMLGEQLELDWIRQATNALPRDNRWQTLARISLRDDIYRLHRSLAAVILQGAYAPMDPDVVLQRWLTRNEESLKKVKTFMRELKAQTRPDLAMLSAALREVRNHLLSF